MAMTKIATATVGAGGSSTIDFTGISSSFTDLLIVHALRSTSTAGPAVGASITFNGSSSGYSERILYNNGSGGAASGSRSGSFLEWAGLINSGLSTANTFSNAQLYIPNYAITAAKQIAAESAQEGQTTTAGYWNHYVTTGYWSGTAAINQVTFTSSAGIFAQYSSITIYGILKGSSGGVTVS